MFRRRHYLINKRIQLEYVGLIIWFIAICMVLVGGLTYYVSLNTIMNEMSRQNVNIEMMKTLHIINITLQKELAVSLLCIVVFMAIVVIFYTHRAVGPVFRFEKTLKEWASGNEFKPIKLRKRDAFQSLAENLNAFAKQINLEKDMVREVLAKDIPDSEKIARVKEIMKI